MKTIIFIAVVTIIAFAAGDTKYYKSQRASASDLTDNTKKLKILIDCMPDTAPCSQVYGTYKAVFAEAVEQKCKRCTSYQKYAFWLFLQGMKSKFPGDYVNFIQKYDPENKYFQDLLSELSKYSSAY